MEGNLHGKDSNGQVSFSSRGVKVEGIEKLQTGLRDSSISDDSLDKIFVAIGKEFKKSKSLLDWALQNSPRSKKLVLVYVHCPDKMVPMGLGGKFPISMLSDLELASHRRQEREKMNEMLSHYLKICSREKVEAEILVIDMDDIANGLVTLIDNHRIPNLIMGAASDRKYSKKMISPSSSKAKFVKEKAASFCRITFVCKGHLIYIREPDSRDSVFSSTPQSENSSCPQESQLPLKEAVIPRRSGLEGMHPQDIPIIFSREGEFRTHSFDILRSTGMEASSGYSSPSSYQVDSLRSTFENLQPKEIPIAVSHDQGLRAHSLGIPKPPGVDVSSIKSLYPPVYEICNSSASPSETQFDDITESMYPSVSQEDIYAQLHQALEEARSAKRETYEESCRRMKAERDILEAYRNVRMLVNLHEGETKRRRVAEEALERETKEVEKLKAKNLDSHEKLQEAHDRRSALEAQLAQLEQNFSEALERETKKAEKLKAENLDSLEKLREASEQNSALEAQLAQLEQNFSEAQLLISSLHEEIQELKSPVPVALQDPGFSIFSKEKLDMATHSFDSSLKIGEGGYGVVYKGTLRNTTFAIKRLHAHNQGQGEFWQEVEALRKVRHPNLVTLIGVCPDAWCLVFEYLSNGNLEDRLSCKDNSAPLSWQSRLCIMVDICSALIFLHSCKPHGIIHGDLKPTNVLLDSGFISKLGDFGLSRLLSHINSFSFSSPLLCRNTDAPKGILAYMDPEILVTGELTVGSDVYSLGVIILRLLTARPAHRITRDVEEALETNTFHRMLDQSAGNWPFVQAKQLANLALQCCAMTHKTRPNLTTGVYRTLELMKNSAYATPSPTHHLLPHTSF